MLGDLQTWHPISGNIGNREGCGKYGGKKMDTATDATHPDNGGKQRKPTGATHHAGKKLGVVKDGEYLTGNN